MGTELIRSKLKFSGKEPCHWIFIAIKKKEIENVLKPSRFLQLWGNLDIVHEIYADSINYYCFCHNLRNMGKKLWNITSKFRKILLRKLPSLFWRAWQNLLDCFFNLQMYVLYWKRPTERLLNTPQIHIAHTSATESNITQVKIDESNCKKEAQK